MVPQRLTGYDRNLARHVAVHDSPVRVLRKKRPPHDSSGTTNDRSEPGILNCNIGSVVQDEGMDLLLHEAELLDQEFVQPNDAFSRL